MSSSRSVNYRARRFVVLLLTAIVGLSGAAYEMYRAMPEATESIAAEQTSKPVNDDQLAIDRLAMLEVKGRAPKTGYARAEFGPGWQTDAIGCTVRNAILKRDLDNVTVDERCRVVGGTLHDPYTGKKVLFVRGEQTSDDVQIDHVVALSNAWQTGAQLLDKSRRVTLANDPMNLLAVEGSVNQQKADSDAATWLPPNKAYRCAYVARQISVKYTYALWVTPAEKDAMTRVLRACPNQPIVSR